MGRLAPTFLVGVLTMRPPTAYMLPTEATVRRITKASGRSGTERTTTEVAWQCNVQEMSSDDRETHGLEESVKGYTLYGATDPAVKHDDQIVVPDLGVLTVLAPAENASRVGVTFKVSCTGSGRV